MSVVRQSNLPAVTRKPEQSRLSAKQVIDKMAKAHDEYVRRNQISTKMREPRHNTLFEAAKNDCAESIAIMVNRGEDVNGREYITDGHMEGHTVLAYAVSCNSLMAAAELIKLGADVNAHGYIGSWSEKSAFPTFRIPMLACANSPESVAMLLEHGANMEARGHDGLTPLLYHARGFDSDGVALLLKHGADADVCDDQGRTAVELWERQFNSWLSDIGRNYGYGLSEPTEQDAEQEDALISDYRSTRALLEEYSKKPLSVEEMFERGQKWIDDGFLNNEAVAVKWFRRAAEQGFIKAQRALVWVYSDGSPPPHVWNEDDTPLAERVPQNCAEAIKWCRRAAEQGDVEMQRRLGEWLEYGENGAAKDKTEAYVWYSLAAEQGDDKATRARDHIGRILPPSKQAKVKFEIQRRQNTETNRGWLSRLWRK